MRARPETLVNIDSQIRGDERLGITCLQHPGVSLSQNGFYCGLLTER